MKIYKDNNLTESVDKLDLGIVEAGTSKEYLFWLHNDTEAELRDLVFETDTDEVEIIESPKTMLPFTKYELRLKWTPSVTVKKGLHCSLCVKGQELWS